MGGKWQVPHGGGWEAGEGVSSEAGEGWGYQRHFSLQPLAWRFLRGLSPPVCGWGCVNLGSLCCPAWGLSWDRVAAAPFAVQGWWRRGASTTDGSGLPLPGSQQSPH